jgi:hypothetical protein
LLIAVGIAGAVFYFVKSGFPFSKRNALELVSSEAVLVFETTEPVMAWNQLVTQPFWSRISELPSLYHAQNQVMALDSLLGKGGRLERALKGNQFVLSLHPVGREEFDFLYTIAFKDLSNLEILKDLENNLPPLSRINTRSYSNIEIKEFQSLDLERNLSYALIGNVFVASYSSFLVEDAIRYAQNSNLLNFKSNNKQLFDALPSAKGLGVIRISGQAIAKIISGISRNTDFKMIDSFSRKGVSANLELKFLDNRVVMEGQAYFQDGKGFDFEASSTGNPKTFQNLISNRTAVYHQYHLKDIEQLSKIEDKGFKGTSTLKGDIEKSLLNQGFLKGLTGEVAFILFELIANEPQDKILLIQSDQIQEKIQLLRAFNASLDRSGLEDSPLDYYQQQEIFMVGAEEFPAHLFGGKFQGFPDTYITSVNDVLVFANSSKAMKLFIDDVHNDYTWGKSLNQKRLIENISPENGFFFMIDIQRFWTAVIENSSPSWKSFFQKYAPQLKSFELLNLSVKEMGKKNAVVMELGYSMNPIKSVQDVLLTENRAVSFSNRLIYGPVIVQNFIDRSQEFVVQDEAHNLYLLTSEGEQVFGYNLDGPIVSGIHQVDFYKNGKLQLLFATEKQVYIIDRLGNLVSGFPVRIEGQTITHLNLVDYNNSRDYRYFIATAEGNLFLLDKNGKALEGWNPKTISGPVSSAPAHHRIAGVGDRMVALSSRGQLYFFNRRGEPELGSPIRLGEGLASDYILLERGSAQESRLVTITTEGEVVQVNLKGELTYRNQLLRPDRESKFYLIKDQKDDRYVFVVHEYNKVTVMDREYKTVFTIDVFSDNLEFQFFSFGSDKNIFVVVDKSQEFIYLYNLEGTLLNTLPIVGDHKVEIKYSGGQNDYTIYTISGNKFSEYKLPI